MMKIEKLDKKLKERLREYLMQDFSKNAIYLYDLDKEYPKRADFSVLLQNEKIKGFNVIWMDNPNFCYLHIIAEDEESFLELLKNSKSHLEKAKRLIISSEFSSILENEFSLVGDHMNLMSLTKGNEKLEIKHPVRRLQHEDLPYIIELLKEGTNLYVKDNDVRNGILKSVENSIDKGLFFGCFINNELVSFIRTTISYPPITMIDTLYTKKVLQRSGAGQSVTSGLIKELFYNRSEFNEIQLYEEKKNLPAFNLYTKLGFKVLKEYIRYNITGISFNCRYYLLLGGL
ncbi:MAG: GNAT family N-acetyltransferase [Candidatus Aenigmatarchaeota archaeon]